MNATSDHNYIDNTILQTNYNKYLNRAKNITKFFLKYVLIVFNTYINKASI